MKHGTIANTGFYEMGVPLLTKKSTLDSSERTTKELQVLLICMQVFASSFNMYASKATHFQTKLQKEFIKNF